MSKEIARRKKQEKRFRFLGLMAIVVSAFFLGSLMVNIIINGYTAFTRVQLYIPIEFSRDIIDPENTMDRAALSKADYRKLVQNGLLSLFPEDLTRKEQLELFALASKGGYYLLREMVLADPSLVGRRGELWLPAASNVELFIKRHSLKSEVGISHYKISSKQFSMIKEMIDKERLKKVFNVKFFTSGDSQEPEQAGILGGFVGSLFTIIVCIAVAFPLGVATALYLEEFAKENWLTDLIDVNINNLAAVPSIIYGLLGLSIYINVMGIPRSSSLVGGLVLALLVLPVIVIATRQALRSVPDSVRYAALALGANKVQIATHHTFIYALPGIMTGVILSIARALGETSPLLLIGMVAFLTEVPKTIIDPATTLPVQIYLWSNNPEFGFVENTAAAIIILLAVLVIINALAAWVRRRFEIKW
jgi:phosphate transport system permease protein